MHKGFHSLGPHKPPHLRHRERRWVLEGGGRGVVVRGMGDREKEGVRGC